MSIVSYLNDGMGDPCAGQMRARLLEATSSKDSEFIFDANFGAADPTGSGDWQ